jgi:outer membrane protein OmpA-like peptidoglycan-associated protein
MRLALALSLLPFAVFAVTPAPAPAAAAKTPSSGAAAAPAQPLQALEIRLDEAVKGLNPQSHAVPDLYASAKARLPLARRQWQDDPKAPETRSAVEACSLLVEAALAQVQAQALEFQRDNLQAQRLAALSRLDSVHDEINKLERGTSASLKADLEEQKRKAQAARDDANKRFDELNGALIQVSKDARGTIISMSDILFDVGKATLTQDLKTNLAKIAGILTIYKDANVTVEGHTDNVGGEEYNQKLSEKRASNVMDFLVSPGGIAPARLTSAGYGFSKPIADNATKEGRQKNRRVDLVIADKKPAQ